MSGEPAPIPFSAQRKVALLVAACFFMEMLDGTIVTTSLPRIAHALSASVGAAGLVVTSYLVTAAALIPVSGWVAARFSGRRTFLAAIAIFTAASLGCALSTTLAELIAMRALQGLGGSMMVPVGRLLVLSRARKQDIMRLTAYLVWPALVAPVIAPLLGGVLTTYASWHWLFLVNIPLGAIALALGSKIVHAPASADAGSFDVRGAVLTCSGAVAAMVAAELLSAARIDGAAAGIAAGAAVVLLALAARHLLRTRAPLLDLRTLRVDTLRAAVLGGSVYFVVIGAGPFLAPLKFEEAFGWSPVKSGSLVLLIFAGNIGIKPATTFIYGRLGFRTVLTCSTALMAVTMVALGLTTAATPLLAIALALTVSGVARSVAATGYNTIAFGDVPERDMRHASTLFTTTTQLASAVGVAGGAIALRLGRPLAATVVSHPAVGARYTVAFWLMALLALLASGAALRLRRSAGEVLSEQVLEPDGQGV